MAVVRITTELRKQLVHKTAMLFVQLIEAAKAERPEVGQAVYNLMMAPYRNDVAMLPEGMLKTSDTVSVQFIGANIYETWALPEPMRMPAEELPETHLGMVEGQYDGLLVGLNRVDETELIFQRMENWKNKVVGLEKAQEKARNDLNTMLSKFNTLAPLLKAWPPLWELLSEATRNEHRRIVTRDKFVPPNTEHLVEGLSQVTVQLGRNRILGKE